MFHKILSLKKDFFCSIVLDTMKKPNYTHTIDPLRVPCPVCNSPYEINFNSISNDWIPLESLQEIDDKIDLAILNLKKERLKIRFAYILKNSPNNPALAAYILAFDFNGIKFDLGRIVYYYDDTFPIKLLKTTFKHLRIHLKDKKFAGGCDE